MRGSEFSADLLLSIWLSLEDYVPGKQRQQAAEQYLRALEEFGIYAEELDVHGHSNHLDKALHVVFPKDDEDEEESEEEL